MYFSLSPIISTKYAVMTFLRMGRCYNKLYKINNDALCEVRGIFCQKIEDYEKEKLRLVRKVIKP